MTENYKTGMFGPDPQVQELQNELAQLQNQLNEAQKTIYFLKGQLAEVNSISTELAEILSQKKPT